MLNWTFFWPEKESEKHKNKVLNHFVLFNWKGKEFIFSCTFFKCSTTKKKEKKLFVFSTWKRRKGLNHSFFLNERLCFCFSRKKPFFWSWTKKKNHLHFLSCESEKKSTTLFFKWKRKRWTPSTFFKWKTKNKTKKFFMKFKKV